MSQGRGEADGTLPLRLNDPFGQRLADARTYVSMRNPLHAADAWILLRLRLSGVELPIRQNVRTSSSARLEISDPEDLDLRDHVQSQVQTGAIDLFTYRCDRETGIERSGALDIPPDPA